MNPPDSRLTQLRGLFAEARSIALELRGDDGPDELRRIANYCTRGITSVGHVERDWR